MSQSCSRALYFWEELLSTLENFLSRPEGFFLTWICFQPHDHGFSSLQTVFLISRSFFCLLSKLIQLRETFFLPGLVPLGFLVRSLSRHGGTRERDTTSKYFSEMAL